MSIIIILFIAGIIVFTIISYFINDRRIKYFLHSTNTPKFFNCNMNYITAKKGLEFFNKHKVIICGLIRDGEKNISLIKNKTEMIGSIFSDYAILIVENDSKDNTRPALLEWAKQNKKVHILGCGENVEKCTMKLPEKPDKVGFARSEAIIRKMVMIRNIYLDYILYNRQLQDFDFTIIWDMDIKGTVYVDGIGTSGSIFEDNPHINGLCANGLHLYNMTYGITATYQDPYAHKELSLKSKNKDILGRLEPEQCVLDGIRKVESCFNGFSIYRTFPLRNIRYEFSLDDDGIPLCEHVGFNSKITNIYINPLMLFVVLYNK